MILFYYSIQFKSHIQMSSISGWYSFLGRQTSGCIHRDYFSNYLRQENWWNKLLLLVSDYPFHSRQILARALSLDVHLDIKTTKHLWVSQHTTHIVKIIQMYHNKREGRIISEFQTGSITNDPEIFFNQNTDHLSTAQAEIVFVAMVVQY